MGAFEVDEIDDHELTPEWDNWLGGVAQMSPNLSDPEQQRANAMLSAQVEKAIVDTAAIKDIDEEQENILGLDLGNIDLNTSRQSGQNTVHIVLSATETSCPRHLHGVVEPVETGNITVCGGCLCKDCFSALPKEALNYQEACAGF